MPIFVSVQFKCRHCGAIAPISIRDEAKQNIRCAECGSIESVLFPGSKPTFRLWQDWFRPLTLILFALTLFFGVVGILVYNQVQKIDVATVTDQVYYKFKKEIQNELQQIPRYLENDKTFNKAMEDLEKRFMDRFQEVLSNEALVKPIVQRLKKEILLEIERMKHSSGFVVEQ